MKDESVNMDATREARDQLVSDFRSLASHADELLKATTSLSGDSIAAVRTRLDQSLKSVRSQLQTLEAQAIGQARQAVVSTDKYVHDKPWQAAGAALLVGLLIGTLAARR